MYSFFPAPTYISTVQNIFWISFHCLLLLKNNKNLLFYDWVFCGSCLLEKIVLYRLNTVLKSEKWIKLKLFYLLKGLNILPAIEFTNMLTNSFLFLLHLIMISYFNEKPLFFEHFLYFNWFFVSICSLCCEGVMEKST